MKCTDLINAKLSGSAKKLLLQMVEDVKKLGKEEELDNGVGKKLGRWDTGHVCRCYTLDCSHAMRELEGLGLVYNAFGFGEASCVTTKGIDLAEKLSIPCSEESEVITYEVTCNGRVGRVFTRMPMSEGAASRLFAAACSDENEEEEVERAALLRSILEKENVIVAIHQGIEPRDVIHAFFRHETSDGLRKAFACSIVSSTRLAHMLTKAPTVVEGAASQVTSTRTITNSVIQTALQAWAKRNYPDMPIPCFSLYPGPSRRTKA